MEGSRRPTMYEKWDMARESAWMIDNDTPEFFYRLSINARTLMILILIVCVYIGAVSVLVILIW